MNKIKKYINFKKQYKKPRLQKIFKKNHEIKIYTLKKKRFGQQDRYYRIYPPSIYTSTMVPAGSS